MLIYSFLSCKDVCSLVNFIRPHNVRLTCSCVNLTLLININSFSVYTQVFSFQPKWFWVSLCLHFCFHINMCFLPFYLQYKNWIKSKKCSYLHKMCLLKIYAHCHDTFLNSKKKILNIPICQKIRVPKKFINDITS